MAADTTQNPLNELQGMQKAIEATLDRLTRPASGAPERLTQAIRYSVLAPGKRMRPLLTLLACQAVEESWENALPAAAAVEFIHVYSLIHDDLPAMDDDDLRRGRPTCHVQFDEATAILAGDSLQMMAIETLCTELPGDVAVDCCRVLSRAAGRSCLVGGQADDLAAEGRFGKILGMEQKPLEFLQAIHKRKTSALIEASLQLGGIIGRADHDALDRLKHYGRCIGLAFQIVDDCLDVESTCEVMGKRTRKDETVGKLTYPQLLGLTESRELANTLATEACETISGMCGPHDHLKKLARFVVERSN